MYCAAGGGGGAVHDDSNNQRRAGGSASSTITAPVGSSPFVSSDGYGAKVPDSVSVSIYGGCGAGWLSDGDDTGVNHHAGGGPTGGHSRLSGWEGGYGRGLWISGKTTGLPNDNNDNISGALTGFGGFGGGGAVFLDNGPHHPGGGGGYSGGGGWNFVSYGGASWGTHFGYNYSNDGKVIITAV